MNDKYINVQIPILDKVNEMEVVKTFTEEQLWYVCAIAKAFEELEKENQELKKQQKEFIKYLEDEISELSVCWKDASCIAEEILSKYKEIIDKVNASEQL